MIQVNYYWSHFWYWGTVQNGAFVSELQLDSMCLFGFARFVSDLNWKTLSWLNKHPRIYLCCEMHFLTSSLKTNVPCWSPPRNQNTSFPVAVCRGVISKYRWADDWNNCSEHMRAARHKTAIVFSKIRKIHSFGFAETNADTKFESHWRAWKNIHHAITHLWIHLSVFTSAFNRN